MLSDESSSDSETGRFKGRSEKKDDAKRETCKTNDSLGRSHTERSRQFGRDRPRETERERFRHRYGHENRELDKTRNRNRYESSRDKYKSSRHSPERHYSREKRDEHRRQSHERQSSSKESNWKLKNRDRSRSRSHKSPSQSHKSPENKQELKSSTYSLHSKDKKQSRERSSSPNFRVKKSVVQKASASSMQKPEAENPIEISEHIESEDEVQPGSYYSMLPAVIKEKQTSSQRESSLEEIMEVDPVKTKEKAVSSENIKSEESSEIDSSDDERLRAKLLNLEKELKRTRKKKHKKKHKKKSSKSNKDRDSDVTIVEVTSTTDIQEKIDEKSNLGIISVENKNLKESSEEGEISSDDNSKKSLVIDESDLRHRLKKTSKTSNKLSSTPVEDVFGPALPPHLKKRFVSDSPEKDSASLPKIRTNIGPSIANDMRKVLAEAAPVEVNSGSSEEDDAIGPLPAGSEKVTIAHQKLEERALDIKLKKMDGQPTKSSDAKTREKWMLELPEAKAKIIGLEARSFRAKQGPDMSDRSDWTDTPEAKARKAAGLTEQEDPGESLQREARSKIIEKRDVEQEESVKKHKKKHKRDESLLDMHQKKMKKKKKREEKEDGPKERRPFSRDVDLQVNKFDEAQKQSIIKKAQQLDTRFSRGEAKYL